MYSFYGKSRVTEEYYEIDVTIQMMSRKELEAYAMRLKEENQVLSDTLELMTDCMKLFIGDNND